MGKKTKKLCLGLTLLLLLWPGVVSAEGNADFGIQNNHAIFRIKELPSEADSYEMVLFGQAEYQEQKIWVCVWCRRYLPEMLSSAYVGQKGYIEDVPAVDKMALKLFGRTDGVWEDCFGLCRSSMGFADDTYDVVIEESSATAVPKGAPLYLLFEDEQTVLPLDLAAELYGYDLETEGNCVKIEKDGMFPEKPVFFTLKEVTQNGIVLQEQEVEVLRANEAFENESETERESEAESESEMLTAMEIWTKVGAQTEREEFEIQSEQEAPEESEVQTEQEVSEEFEIRTEQETKAGSEIKTERETEPKPETESKSETESESETETESETLTAMEAWSMLETHAEIESETDAEAKPESPAVLDSVNFGMVILTVSLILLALVALVIFLLWLRYRRKRKEPAFSRSYDDEDTLTQDGKQSNSPIPVVKGISVQGAVVNNKGLVRGNNEDNFYFNGAYMHRGKLDDGAVISGVSKEDVQLYAVCDGMGGTDSGEDASHCAAKELALCRQEHGCMDDPQKLTAMLRRISEKINREAVQKAQKSGTTIAMILIKGRKAVLANVGDSRIYRMRDRGLKQMSLDHSKVQRMISMGLLTPEKARTDPNRHVITQYLGMPTDVKVSPYIVEDAELKKGDVFVLCSDGLTDMAEDSEIEAILKQKGKPQDAAQELVKTALRHGGRDNVTVMVLRI